MKYFDLGNMPETWYTLLSASSLNCISFFSLSRTYIYFLVHSQLPELIKKTFLKYLLKVDSVHRFFQTLFTNVMGIVIPKSFIKPSVHWGINPP